LKSHNKPHHQIEVFVDRIEQLFNSMDPSPFQERDLDDDAEEFIVSWAQEFPRRDPVSLVINVNQIPGQPDAPAAARVLSAHRTPQIGCSQWMLNRVGT